jgi:hypothetical protein
MILLVINILINYTLYKENSLLFYKTIYKNTNIFSCSNLTLVLLIKLKIKFNCGQS